MSDDPGTSPPPAAHRAPAPHPEHGDPRQDLTQALAAFDARTVERDQALAQARQACAERDSARAQVERLQTQVGELEQSLARYRSYPCPAQTPVHHSVCRFRFGHFGNHKTTGGWSWSQ